MIKKNNNEVTLEKLAGMVARGFDEIKLEMVTKSEFNFLKSEFNFLKSEFNFLRGEFKSLNKKVDKLDYQVDEVYDILKQFEENDILNLQKRVQILERAVKAIGNQIMK